MKHKLFHRYVLFLSVIAITGLLAGCGDTKKAAVTGVTAESATGNIQATITRVTVGSPPVVTFTLHDENGFPLNPRTVIDQGGRVRFTIARIGADGNYQNYILNEEPHPTFDPGGTFADTAVPGTYTYTFATDITANDNLIFDATLTHTVAAQIQRDVTSAVGTPFRQSANPYFNFRPDGGPVTVTREVVAISNCNECHGNLGLHGGGRREIALCILCHYPGPVDVVTGNAIDFKSLIHKIHMGENLPSNQALIEEGFTGGGYTIETESFNTVVYPFMSGDDTISERPVNCTKCHRLGTDLTGKPFGRNVDNWKNNPTRAKCTTCHDLTTFDGSATVDVADGATPVTIDTSLLTTVPNVGPHTEGPQADDSLCASAECHPNTVEEFSSSVPGAHTIFEQSSVFTGINFQILSVTNATAGNAPTVVFSIRDDAGNPLDPAAAGSSFNFKLGYKPGADYTNDGLADFGEALTQSLTASTDNGDGTRTITFATPIPDFATGVGVIGMEGRATYSITTPHKGTISPRAGGMSIQYYFDLATGNQVTDPALTRREVVDVSKCLNCHGRLSLHGANRVNSTFECVICHNPNATDRSERPGGGEPDGLAERPIDFKVMIHSIHTGEDLNTKPYIIFGFGGSVNDFSEVRFPRDRRDCLGCHKDADPDTQGLPLFLGVMGTTISTGSLTNNVNNAGMQEDDNTSTLPIKAVCTSCHDDALTSSHADGRVVRGVETCVQCHRTGLLLGTDFAHLPTR